jgi:hypothetical protein
MKETEQKSCRVFVVKPKLNLDFGVASSFLGRRSGPEE